MSIKTGAAFILRFSATDDELIISETSGPVRTGIYVQTWRILEVTEENKRPHLECLRVERRRGR
jgi:hypothetical protein